MERNDYRVAVDEIDLAIVKTVPSEGTLVVSEIFGPTIQGEGPNIGKPVGFLRLGGCNLHCVWCDTPYTWRFSEKLPHDRPEVYDPKIELRRTSYGEILERVAEMHVSRLVVTGGEPLLQSKNLGPLLETFVYQHQMSIEIETNGTVIPDWPANFNVQYNVSPKLENSGNSFNRRRNSDALKWFAAANYRAVFKFVVAGPHDLEEIDEIVEKYHIQPHRVYCMPLGITAEDVEAHAQAVARDVLDRRWNLTTRLHVQLWGNRRGV